MIRMTSTDRNGSPVPDSEEKFDDMESLRLELEGSAAPEYVTSVMEGLHDSNTVTVPNGSIFDMYKVE